MTEEIPKQDPTDQHPTDDSGEYRDVTVRVLTHTRIDAEDDTWASDHYAARSQSATLRSDGDISNEVLGYALVEPGTRLTNYEDAGVFVSVIDDAALRVDWIRRPTDE